MPVSYCTRCGSSATPGAIVCPTCALPIAATPPRAPGDWGVWPVLVGLLALLPPVLLIALLAQAPIPLAALTAVSAALLGLVQVALVWVLALRSPRPSPALLALVGLTTIRWPPRRAIRNIIATLAAMAASIAFSWLYATAVGILGWDFLLPEPPPTNIILPGGLAIFSFIALAVWTPLAEELFFRGFVMSGLVYRFGLTAGLIASAAIFAVLHISPPNLLPIFVIGLLLGGLYRYTGSIWPGIFFHLAQNTLALAAVLLQPGN